MNNITDSVARLYRAGSEHSKSAEKLREAVDELLLWMKQNVPEKLSLPLDCEFDPKHENLFRRSAFNPRYPNDRYLIFSVVRGKSHSREELLSISRLIAEGFLDKLSEHFEKEVGVFSGATAKIEVFVAPKG